MNNINIDLISQLFSFNVKTINAIKATWYSEVLKLPKLDADEVFLFLGTEVLINASELTINNGNFVIDVTNNASFSASYAPQHSILYKSINVVKTADGSRYSFENCLSFKPLIPIPINNYLTVSTYYAETQPASAYIKVFMSKLKISKVKNFQLREFDNP